MYGVFDLIKKDFFKENSKILIVHTGGLQGWNGIDATFLENFDTQQ
jgi:1-aminocyclopropane-1-carboxylate deaminase